jgi:predicted O-methyltransferase YrrM
MTLVRRAARKFRNLARGVSSGARLNEKLTEALVRLDKQSDLFSEMIGRLNDQSEMLDGKLTGMIHRQNAQIELQKAEITAIRAMLTGSGERIEVPRIELPPVPPSPIDELIKKRAFAAAMARIPLSFAPKTYNTSHPKYDPVLVRNFSGKIFNAYKSCNNAVYASVKRLAKGDQVAESAWGGVLEASLAEAKTVPHANEVFERQAYIEEYLRALAGKYGAHYSAGWVNRDDAVFLYWLVRKLNPRTVVQTGVSNGLSSAFIMLALAKNNAQGRLHVIDLPAVFNPHDPGWTIADKVYGVVIPEGKTSGWMVPDAYRDRFEVWNGDAKELLPQMVDKVDSIDLFFHDSDHSYDHMMFEFREAKRKLKAGGLVVADDVSWNASVWDFADEYEVPSFNFKGTIGVAFF